MGDSGTLFPFFNTERPKSNVPCKEQNVDMRRKKGKIIREKSPCFKDFFEI